MKEDTEISLFEKSEFALTPSFNNKTLLENLQIGFKNIEFVDPLQKIHDHSQSNFMWDNFNLSHWTKGRNLRQIAAEISKKKMALTENLLRIEKERIEMKIIAEKLESKPVAKSFFKKRDNEMTPAERELLEHEYKSMEIKMKESIKPIEGCLKDIAQLTKRCKELGIDNWTVEDFENDEVRYYIMRIFAQSLRDIRTSGKILNGNQEALEQMGFNPTTAWKIMSEFLTKDQDEPSMSSTSQDKFLEEMAEKYKDLPGIKIGIKGMKNDYTEPETVEDLDLGHT